jgi:hypothetical protein
MSKYHHNHPKWEVDFKSIKEGVGIEEVGRILGLRSLWGFYQPYLKTAKC